MRRAGVLLLAVGCGACGAQSTTAPVVTVPIASAAPPVATEAHEAAVIPAQDAASCTFRAARWPSGAVGLRFRAGVRPFAKVLRGTEVELALPSGKSSIGAALHVNAGGVVVGGNIEEKDVPLKPAKPFVVRGFLIPEAGQPLVWESGAPGTLDVSFELDPQIQLVTPGTRSTRACGDLAIDAASFEAWFAIGVELDRKPALLRGASVPLAVDAGGPAVAHVDASRAIGVDVLETRGSSSRATWSAGSVVVFGWVPSSAIHPPPTGGLGYGTGTGFSGVGSSVSSRWIACKHELPLFARVDGEEHAVGTVRPGVMLDVGEGTARLRVTFPHAAIRPAEGAAFLVNAADLEGCGRAR